MSDEPYIIKGYESGGGIEYNILCYGLWYVVEGGYTVGYSPDLPKCKDGAFLSLIDDIDFFRTENSIDNLEQLVTEVNKHIKGKEMENKAKLLVENHISKSVTTLVQRLQILEELSVDSTIDYEAMKEEIDYDEDNGYLSNDEIADLYESSFGEIVYKEPLEFWIVSDWLAEKLREKGEVIIDYEHVDFYIWGRSCSGQAIYLDGVIREIAIYN